MPLFSYVICFYLYMSTYCTLQFPFLSIYPKSIFDLTGSALLTSMFQDIHSRLSTLSCSTAFVVHRVAWIRGGSAFFQASYLIACSVWRTNLDSISKFPKDLPTCFYLGGVRSIWTFIFFTIGCMACAAPMDRRKGHLAKKQASPRIVHHYKQFNIGFT
ncbi:hypothetical protein BDV11DRAFT_85578 [Aspergillus similis]